MDLLAQLLWNPFLSIMYLVLGGLFVALTRAAAWRRSLPVFLAAWRTGRRAEAAHEIEHRDAFVSALAASVGVGNLAGVATALHLGGPGALFWMWVSALLGMYFRLTSAYMAVERRPPEPNNLAYATPMSYLEADAPRLAKIVAMLLLLAGLLNANLIQTNSVAHSLTLGFGVPRAAVAFGAAAAIALVVMGGVRSIVRVSVRIAPLMVLLYVGMGVLVLLREPGKTLDSLAQVFSLAFEPYAAGGGVAGYGVLTCLQYGVSRGVFSHGSGIGAAPFFQSANADHPARAAYMAAMVPLFDTLFVCTITGLVILSQGFWQFWTGAYLTVSAFDNALGSVGKDLVFACLAVFAFTTITAWAHYSERCFAYLGGENLVLFRALFCAVSFCGPFLSVEFVWSLADVLIGLLLLFHLLPLSYVAMRHSRAMLRDLGEPELSEEAVSRPRSA